MATFLPSMIVGVIVIVIGVLNMMGNISFLHSYHRHRVTEENRKPFGKLVGIGTVINGISILIFGTLMLVYEKTQITAFSISATALLLVGIVLGLIVTFRAMLKYNGGIF